jgi:perosamine synthetase
MLDEKCGPCSDDQMRVGRGVIWDRFRWINHPRLVGLLGGTTTLNDCLIALRHLIYRNELVQGPAIMNYERAFAKMIGVRYAYSFAAGRVGLYGTLQALGIGPGDDVLLHVPSHIVVANAVRYAGARPVYVDCTLENYNMDLDEAERKVTHRTRAIILQHTFGIPVDMDAALALARRHKLEVIEDCVHALGSTYRGRPVGSFGRAAVFSTEETKTISTTMGGMVVTDDPDLAIRVQTFQAKCSWSSSSLAAGYLVKLILYHLYTQPHMHRYIRDIYVLCGRQHPLPKATSLDELRGMRPLAYEQRMSNGQAAIGLQQLKQLSTNVAHRRAIAVAYRTRLSEMGFNAVQVPPQADPVYVRYPVWVEDRATVMRVATRDVTLGDWFTSVLEEAVSPASGGYEMGSCPRAEEAARHLVNLPTHPRVTLRDVSTIVSTLARVGRLA